MRRDAVSGFVFDWRAYGGLCVCVSLFLALGVLPQFAPFFGSQWFKTLPIPVKILLAAMPLQVALLASAALPALLARGGGSWCDRLALGPFSWRIFRFVLIFEAALFPVLLIVSGASGLIIKHFQPGVDIQQQLVLQALKTSPGGFAVLVFSAVIVAPLAEELAFRRVLFGFLESFAGTVPAAVTTALVFAVSHCSLVQVPALFLLGLCLQWLCKRFNSTTPAILLHALHNTLSMSLIFVMRAFGVQL